MVGGEGEGLRSVNRQVGQSREEEPGAGNGVSNTATTTDGNTRGSLLEVAQVPRFSAVPQKLAQYCMSTVPEKLNEKYFQEEKRKRTPRLRPQGTFRRAVSRRCGRSSGRSKVSESPVRFGDGLPWSLLTLRSSECVVSTRATCSVPTRCVTSLQLRLSPLTSCGGHRLPRIHSASSLLLKSQLFSRVSTCPVKNTAPPYCVQEDRADRERQGPYSLICGV